MKSLAADAQLFSAMGQSAASFKSLAADAQAFKAATNAQAMDAIRASAAAPRMEMA